MQVEGIVTRLEGERAFVQVARQSGCGRCHEAGGCKSGQREDPQAQRCNEYALENVCDARLGNRVTVEVPEGATLRAVLFAYVLPVLAFVVFSGLGQLVFGSDFGAFVAGLAGLGLAVFVMRRYGSGGRNKQHPRIVSVIHSS